MMFELIPILQKIAELYQLPRDKGRFDTYLKMLQGDGSDMELPIAGFNPMAKENALIKLQELIDLKAEDIALEAIELMNSRVVKKPEHTISVVLNMVDDIGGSWSSRFTTDYTSKFDFEPILKRNFCTPHFWTGEEYSPELIRNRVLEYIHRSVYVTQNGKAQTLKEHVDQEVYALASNEHQDMDTQVSSFYQKHKDSTDYALIFNFLYGDQASEILNYKCYGIPEMGGWRYIQSIKS